MKLRSLAFVVVFSLLLAACSMAEDITPPPDYVADTPAPVVEATSTATLEPTPTPEPVATLTDEPLAGATDVPVATDEAIATPESVLLTFAGRISTGDESALEPGLVVDLHQYDMSSGIELAALPGGINTDGTYSFPEIPAVVDSQMAYWVSVEYQGVPYTSDFATYDGLTTTFDLPVTIYESSSDYSLLTIPQVEMYFLFDTEGVVQVFQLYRVVNPSTVTVVFPIPDSTIPFISTPEGAQDVQFSPGSTSAPFLTATDGVAMPPSGDLVYEIVTVFTLPYEKRLTIEMPFVLTTDAVEVYVEAGIKVKSKDLTEVGPTAIQEINFVQYEAADVAAESSIALTVSGSVTDAAAAAPALDQNLIIGIGAVGILLIAAGIFLFVRERKRAREEDELLGEEDEEEGEDALGDDPEEIMDAIIALDDQYKAGGIAKEAYEVRRAELKARLKE